MLGICVMCESQGGLGDLSLLHVSTATLELLGLSAHRPPQLS